VTITVFGLFDHIPNSEKRVGNTMYSKVFLLNFEVFGK